MSAGDDRFSENEDDPGVYESSGDEWSAAAEKKRNKRRMSHRLSKKPRITHVETTSEDEADEKYEAKKKPKPKNGMSKRGRKPNSTTAASVRGPQSVTNDEAEITSNSNTVKPAVQYLTGTFVILKKDAFTADLSNPPCIWKVDGKALLQKYMACKEDGKIRHRNTSVYTGWSALDKDQYSPVKVHIHECSGLDVTVEVDWEDLKTINIDSD